MWSFKYSGSEFFRRRKIILHICFALAYRSVTLESWTVLCVLSEHTTKVKPDSQAWLESALEEQDGAQREPVSPAVLRFQQNKELS